MKNHFGGCGFGCNVTTHGLHSGSAQLVQVPASASYSFQKVLNLSWTAKVVRQTLNGVPWFQSVIPQELQELSRRWTHHCKRHVNVQPIAKSAAKKSSNGKDDTGQTALRVVLSALEGKTKFFFVYEAATKHSLFHDSIVHFFPINFRIHCRPFWVTMQAQLAAPWPQSSIECENDVSANFEQLLLLSRFLSNPKTGSFR